MQWSCDVSDVSEHRYQPGRTKQAIYAFDNGYYAYGAVMPKDIGDGWVKHSDQSFCSEGKSVWFMPINT